MVVLLSGASKTGALRTLKTEQQTNMKLVNNLSLKDTPDNPSEISESEFEARITQSIKEIGKSYGTDQSIFI